MSINSKMTALADEIRELSGTTTAKSINAMTNDVNAANVEINEQAALITQIATALEGKATGGGGSLGEWISLSSLPTSYPVYEDITVYLPLPENTKIILMGYALDTTCFGVITINDGYITPNMPREWGSSFNFGTEEADNVKYLSITFSTQDVYSEAYFLPLPISLPY